MEGKYEEKTVKFAAYGQYDSWNATRNGICD